MSRRLEQASSVLRTLDATWSAAQVEQSLSRLHLRQRRRHLTQVGAALSATLVLAIGLITHVTSADTTDESAVDATRLTFPDGSVARLSAPGVARVAEATSSLIAVELLEGHAIFDVVHREARRFVIRAGAVSIVDLGTVFSVERQPNRVRVAVETGKVRVDAPNESLELVAGESRWFSEQLDDVLARAPEKAKTVPPASQKKHATRTEAADQKVSERFERVDATPKESSDELVAMPRDEVNESLLAADAHRRAGRVDEAIVLLERILQSHTADERAPLAAFTLGKLQLDVGRAEAAANAFFMARALAPQGPLVEDALGRELDAVERAGDATRARLVAEEYLERFPSGVRAGAARRALVSP